MLSKCICTLSVKKYFEAATVGGKELCLPAPLLLTWSSCQAIPSRAGDLWRVVRSSPGHDNLVSPPEFPILSTSNNATLIPLFTFQHCLNKLHKSRGWSNLYTDNSCSLSQPNPVSSRLNPPQPRPSLDSVSSGEEIISEINLVALLRGQTQDVKIIFWNEY